MPDIIARHCSQVVQKYGMLDLSKTSLFLVIINLPIRQPNSLLSRGDWFDIGRIKLHKVVAQVMLFHEGELPVQGLGTTHVHANACNASTAHHDAPRVADELMLMRDQDNALPPPNCNVLYCQVGEDTDDSQVDGLRGLSRRIMSALR
jgi:hypothetical protein